jgi:hypothetical protein
VPVPLTATVMMQTPLSTTPFWSSSTPLQVSGVGAGGVVVVPPPVLTGVSVVVLPGTGMSIVPLVALQLLRSFCSLALAASSAQAMRCCTPVTPDGTVSVPFALARRPRRSLSIGRPPTRLSPAPLFASVER